MKEWDMSHIGIFDSISIPANDAGRLNSGAFCECRMACHLSSYDRIES
jgi:hypothetical protein